MSTITAPSNSSRRWFSRGAVLLSFALVGAVVAPVSPAFAAGPPTVVINGGGGDNPDGSDGLRIEVNRSSSGSSPDRFEQIFHKGAAQYSGDGQVGPHLYVGGKLFAQTAARASADGSTRSDWTSVEVVDVAGSAVDDTSSALTGSGSATIQYTATVDSLDYVVLRTVTYVAGDAYFTDEYTFTIPAENEHEVKFYQGGNTTPRLSGSSWGLLHGTVQHHLVLLGASVRGVISALPVGTRAAQEDVGRLTEIERKLDEIREYDVREMSHLLYPEGLDLGLIQAVRMMLRRVPSSIRVQTHIDEDLAEYDDPAFERVAHTVRLLAVRVLEEAVSNALRHGNASRIEVTLQMDGDHLLAILVDDDGTGVRADAVLSGLERLRERLHQLGGRIDLEPGRLQGARLVATIPLGSR